MGDAGLHLGAAGEAVKVPPTVLAQWNARKKRYVPVLDAYASFQLALSCKYPITENSHPVRRISTSAPPERP